MIMKMPYPKWLILYAWFILLASLIETVLAVSGDVSTRLVMAACSLVSVVFGFGAAAFVLGGHFTLAKSIHSIFGASYLGQLESIATLVFWFGIAASAAVVLSYPLLAKDYIRFSTGPIGIGITLGAWWAFNRYNPATNRKT